MRFILKSCILNAHATLLIAGVFLLSSPFAFAQNQTHLWDPKAPPAPIEIPTSYTGISVGVSPRTASPHLDCVNITQQQQWNEAINALNRIPNESPVVCNVESLDARYRRANLIAVNEKEKEALASYVFMNYLYGTPQGRPIDTNTTATMRDQVCKLMTETTREAAEHAKATHQSGSDQLDPTAISHQNNCSNPEIAKKVDASIALAQNRLKKIGYKKDMHGNLDLLNHAVQDLANACAPIRARAEQRTKEWESQRDSKNTGMINRGSAGKDSYEDWMEKEKDNHRALSHDSKDQQDLAKANTALKSIFGSYYGRLITANPTLMRRIGLSTDVPLNSAEMCVRFSKGTITEAHLAEAMETNNDKIDPKNFSFVDAVRNQLSTFAGEKIPALAPFNEPENLREKVAYEFLMAHDSSAIQNAIRKDPELKGAICQALQKQAFWESPKIKAMIESGKMVGTAFAMVGGIALAPFTAGSSVAGALILVSTLAINETTYHANDHAMRTDQTKNEALTGKQVRTLSSESTDEMINNAGGVQQSLQTTQELTQSREKLAEEQKTNRAAVVASMGAGMALGKVMSVTSEMIGAETRAGVALSRGMEVQVVKGLNVGASDLVDQVIYHQMTGEWNTTGFVLGKVHAVANAKFIDIKNQAAATALLRKKFTSLNDGDTPSTQQKLALAQDIQDQMKASGAKNIPDKLTILGQINQALVDATPEKVNAWMQEVKSGPNSTPEGKAAFSKLEAVLKEKFPNDPDKVAQLLTDAYVAHSTGKSGVGTPGTPGYQAMDSDKQFALGTFAKQLRAAGIPETEILGNGKEQKGLVRQLAEAHVLGNKEENQRIPALSTNSREPVLIHHDDGSMTVEAPPKNFTKIDPSLVKTQKITLHDDGSHAGEVVLPDPNTPIGRYASALEKKGIKVILSDDAIANSGEGTGGYAVEQGEWTEDGVNHSGPMIVLKSKQIDLTNGVQGHETYHATTNLNQTTRSTQSQFDGELTAKAGGRGMPTAELPKDAVITLANGKVVKGPELEAMLKNLYGDFSDQEVHTYSKDFTSMIFKNSNKQTMQQIEAATRTLPKELSRQEKLQQIKLNTSDVIDENQFNKRSITTQYMIDTRLNGLKEIQNQLPNLKLNIQNETPSIAKLSFNVETSSSGTTSIVLSNKDFSYSLLNIPKSLSKSLIALEAEKSTAGYSQKMELMQKEMELMGPYLQTTLTERIDFTQTLSQQVKTSTQNGSNLLKEKTMNAQQYLDFKNNMSKIGTLVSEPNINQNTN